MISALPVALVHSYTFVTFERSGPCFHVLSTTYATFLISRNLSFFHVMAAGVILGGFADISCHILFLDSRNLMSLVIAYSGNGLDDQA